MGKEGRAFQGEATREQRPRKFGRAGSRGWAGLGRTVGQGSGWSGLCNKGYLGLSIGVLEPVLQGSDHWVVRPT